MSNTTNVGILNVTGYVGAELARLLHVHPNVRIVGVTGRSAAGKRLSEVFPHLFAMDLPIARIYQDARAARIYDGASEVHRMVIARECFKLALQGQSTTQATGDLR